MSAERAYRAVRDAIKRGELMRPDSCQRCGRTPGPAADGRSGIQGHHHDYDAPLDVEWICAACHRLETPLPSKPGGRSYGENNGSHKLTRDKAAEIRTSQLSCRLLAHRYGVDRKTIERIRANQAWREHPEPQHSAGKED